MSTVRVTRLFRDGDKVDDDELAEEAPLEIQVREHDGIFRSVAVVMRTPHDDDGDHDEDLALGFLRTEGVIAGFHDVVRVAHCTVAPSPEAEGNVVQVQLKPGVVVDWSRLTRHTFASSSCGVCGKATIDAVLQALPSSPRTPNPRPAMRWANVATQRLAEHQVLFTRTGGTHAAMLIDDVSNDVLVVAEDVGRHNAVDVVIGRCLRTSTTWEKTTLVLSGRIAFEIVQKAAAVGIGTIVAVGAPTSLAIELAQRAGITVLGFVRPNRVNHYC